jgi:hypothetical protein
VSWLPLAHAGHYLWLLYLPPVLIVGFAILRSVIAQRREDEEDDENETAEAERRQRGGH